ncbi:hypothetical protein AMTR_s00001p00025290 [Amborella trichopoda]|uniref:Uncharacterized protein n=2 Tax=Amborella trichopoda TaxID=13333 RepID=W1NKU1_AMBTC|nr:hypothetical protein AMTR_s00001p00025290 [Amborella trichopoda]
MATNTTTDRQHSTPTKKGSLRDMQNDAKSTNGPEPSGIPPLPKAREPIDIAKASGAKRQRPNCLNPNCSISALCSNCTNGHLVYVRRRVEQEPIRPPSCTISKAEQEPMETPSCTPSRAKQEQLNPPSCASSRAEQEPMKPPLCTTSRAEQEPRNTPSCTISRAEQEPMKLPSCTTSTAEQETMKPPSCTTSTAEPERMKPPSCAISCSLEKMDSFQLTGSVLKPEMPSDWGCKKNPTLSPKISCFAALAPLPTSSLVTYSSAGPSVPQSLGKNNNLSGSGDPNCGDERGPQEASLQNLKERLHRLEVILRQLDESKQEQYVQRLRSLPAVARSKHAVELERRVMSLMLEEGKEMKRMRVLNVFGKPG